MRLEIRDIDSATVYDIGSEGAVLGRERARTDISLRDESISKRHARIFAQDGDWFLEDLNSSNGTYVDDQRITAPIRLGPGRLFSLAQRRFEVTYIEGAAGAMNGAGPSDDFGPPSGAPTPYDETGGELPPMGGPAEPNSYGGHDFSFEDDPEPKGIGYFFVAVPKAIGFYLIEVPLMALNPIGRINRSFVEQPLAAMTNLETAAYGIPAFFVTTLVAALFAVLTSAINGPVSFDPLLLALPTGGIAAAIGGIAGFVAHPILRVLVDLLKGESAPKSRTNCIIHGFVLTILAAVPNGISALLAVAPVPYVHLVGPLLLMLVAAVLLYFQVQWMKVFDVIKPVQYVMIGLGALAVIYAAIGFVNGTIDAIDGVGPNGRQVVAAGTSPASARDAMPAVGAETAAVTASDESDGDESDSKATPLPTKEEQKTIDQVQAAADGRDKAEVPPMEAAPEPTERGRPRSSGDNEAATLAASIVDPEDIPTDKYPLGLTEFAVFLRKRAAIEHAIDADPSLVSRRDIRRDYERMWRTTYEIRDKYYRMKGPRWKRDKIFQREKGQEIFKKTKVYVNRIYGKLIQSSASKR